MYQIVRIYLDLWGGNCHGIIRAFFKRAYKKETCQVLQQFSFWRSCQLLELYFWHRVSRWYGTSQAKSVSLLKTYALSWNTLHIIDSYCIGENRLSLNKSYSYLIAMQDVVCFTPNLIGIEIDAFSAGTIRRTMSYAIPPIWYICKWFLRDTHRQLCWL